jgi:hypothetical protein
MLQNIFGVATPYPLFTTPHQYIAPNGRDLCAQLWAALNGLHFCKHTPFLKSEKRIKKNL